jgi:hypothetical protein
VILTAYQPAYLPWLGLFHKIALSDTFCLLDAVDYSKQNFINRNRIKTAKGPLWLSVPVHAGFRTGRRICDIRIADRPWRRKHIASIVHAYAKAPHFDRYAPEIFSILNARHVFLADLTGDLLRLFLRQLGITVKVVRSSDYDFTGRKDEYILDMCKTLGASVFIFGGRGKNYASADLFREAGIDAIFLEYCHPHHRQRHGAYLPEMSVIDLLFNEGPQSLNVILSGNPKSVAEVALASAKFLER